MQINRSPQSYPAHPKPLPHPKSVPILLAVILLLNAALVGLVIVMMTIIRSLGNL